MPETFTKDDIKRVQNTFEKIVARYRVALADAIRRPLGVIPDSAKELISSLDIEMAEKRREIFGTQDRDNPVAFANDDSATEKQIEIIRLNAKSLGIDADEYCLQNLNCRLDVLSQTAADKLIEMLQKESAPRVSSKNLSCSVCNRFLSDGKCVGWNCPANPEAELENIREQQNAMFD